MGLHTGEAIKAGRDFYSSNVILVSRIADEAQPGQILVSSPLMEQVKGSGDLEFGPGREVELKGLPGPELVDQVGWEQSCGTHTYAL